MIRWREILEKKEAENSAFTLTLAQGLSHGEEKYVISNMFYRPSLFRSSTVGEVEYFSTDDVITLFS